MDSLIRIIGCFVLGFSLISTANAASTKPMKTSDIGLAQLFPAWTTLEPLPVNLDFETIATTPQGQQVTRHTTRPVPLSKGRLGSLGKSVLGGPVAIGVTAAFLAYDYFYDDDTQEWKVNVPTGVTGIGSCNPRYGASITNRSFSQCVEIVRTFEFQGTAATSVTANPLSTNTMRITSMHNTTTLLNSWVRDTAFGGSNGEPYIPTSTAISDDQAGEAIKNAPHQTIQDVLNDPISTGTWRDRWPEIEPVVKDVEDTIGYDVEGTPTENYDPTISDGSTATPKPVTQTGSTPTATEWPTFCSWAGVVCDFIDWFKEEPTPPETPEMPTEEIQAVEWESGLGSGSCPANPVTSFNGETIEYDLTNACWGASTIFKPILLVLSLIGAAYIIVGARS
jgi:hypothetical protein